MAKVTFTTLTDPTVSPSAATTFLTNLNANFVAAQTALENAVWRDGTDPNAMAATLHLGDYRLGNAVMGIVAGSGVGTDYTVTPDSSSGDYTSHGFSDGVYTGFGPDIGSISATAFGIYTVLVVARIPTPLWGAANGPVLILSGASLPPDDAIFSITIDGTTYLKSTALIADVTASGFNAKAWKWDAADPFVGTTPVIATITPPA